MSNPTNAELIETAKEFLKENGYFTDNLWHINDVLDKHDGGDATDDEAMEILANALTNPRIISEIQEQIQLVIDEKIG